MDDAAERFVAAMRRAHAGREMTERVFRSLTGAPMGHSASLYDHELASYLLAQGWTFADVVRRES